MLLDKLFTYYTLQTKGDVLIGALIGVVGPAVANQWSLIVVYWVAERT